MRLSTITSTIVMTLCLILTIAPAHADVFNFSYIFDATPDLPTPVSASGVLTTTPFDTTVSAYLITGISGTRVYQGVTQNIFSLLPPGSYGGNDNLLYPENPFLSSNGFSYTVDGVGNSGSAVNVFYDPSQGGYTENGDNIGVGTFTVTPADAIPESRYSFFVLIGLAAVLLRYERTGKARQSYV